ncbi:MAG TPA: formylglycine-generating enzyme family protein [Myxococcota bacterium]|nr:formylglycine-generating enzyme family protein [Myxococcota bacterium]
MPACAGKECGDDGCGGTCTPGCGLFDTCNASGSCDPCVPDCTNRNCGDDKCGGTCGPGCGPLQVCDPGGQCIDCSPDCSDKSCCELDEVCGVSCEQILCDAGQVCWNSGTDCSCCDCAIDEMCLDRDTVNQALTCEFCDPEGAGGTDAWSVENGFCSISGSCHTDDTTNPDNFCEYCDAQEATTSWTSEPDGAACREGPGVCQNGVCCQPDCSQATCCEPFDGCGGECDSVLCVGNEVCDPGECICSSWVQIGGGEFMMGDNDGATFERPAHLVTVQPFEMMSIEVTTSDYEICPPGVCAAAGTNLHCNFQVPGRENDPINCVTWQGAKDYCAWITPGGRLPTEAEWEWAARSGGSDDIYPWGDTIGDCQEANAHVANGCQDLGTWPVCSFPSGNSDQGLCDLAGNVAEWVEDVWHVDYDNAPDDGSAWVTGGDTPSKKVVRGGSYQSAASALRATSRSWQEFYISTSSQIGFRCVR